LAGVAWWPASRLSYDRSIENLFAPGDPLVESFAKLKRVFGRHEIVMVVYEDRELMLPAGQRRLQELASTVRRTPGVASILSLATIPGLASAGDEGRAAALRKMFERYTHGPDGRTAAVVTMLEPEQDSPLTRPEVLTRLHAIAHDLPRGAVIGEPVLIDESFAMLQADSRRLLTWCAGLLSLTLLFVFRSIRWVVCAVGVVAVAVITTRGLVWVGGMQLSLVSTMLPAVITVIGVATVMHVAVRQRQAIRAGQPPQRALQGVLIWLLAPIAWACATDAAGFASLLVSSVQPVRDFGVMMIVGSLFVLPAVIAVVPALALATTTRTTRSHAPCGNRILTTRSHALRGNAIQRRSASRLAGIIAPALPLTGLILFLSVIGSTRLQVETDFTKNFRADSPVVEAYEFVEDRLGGAGVWDIILPAPSRLDAAFVARVRQLEERLVREVPDLAKTLSLADAVQALAGGAADRDFVVTASDETMQRLMPHFYHALYNVDSADPERHFLRVMLRAPERMTAAEKLATIDKVRRIALEAFPEAEVTGYYVLLANLVTSLNRDQWLSLAAAAMGVFLMMAVAFHSARLAAVGVIVNGLPVLVVFGAMGWLGIPLNMGGAMSAAVSLGLAVDASIHLITAYRRALFAGQSSEDAVRSALGTVGRPVVLATAALVVGLMTLCFSEFVPTVHFGILVSATMVGGLLGNLVLLPAILKASGVFFRGG
jgi:predicted RND superfamily exporter protein